MSVFFDHRRRYGDDEQGAIQDRRDDDGTLWGFAYDRIEGVVHLTLAFTIVGGAAVILSSALFSPGAPLGGPVEKPAVARQAVAAPTAPVVVTAKEAVAPKEAPPPVAVKTPPAPVAPIQQVERASAEPVSEAPGADPYLDARPMTESAAPATAASAPEPLAPPSADMREKLVARQDVAPPLAAAPVQETAAPPAEANAYQAPAALASANVDDHKAEPPPAADESKAEAGGRMAKCYLKLSGKVQNSGACRVNHAGENVIFHLPGKPLELAHDRGRVWTATLGGRNLGKVYKNKGAPCWGAKGFYACENG